MSIKIRKKVNSIIEKKTKKIKFDLNYFLNNGFWTTSYLIFDMIGGLILSFFLIKYLDQKSLGLWYFIISVVGIASIFTLNGFNIIARKKFIEKKYKSYTDIYKIRLFSSLIGSIIFLILTSILFYIKHDFWIYSLFVSFLIPFTNLRLYVDYLYSKDKIKTIAIQAIFKYVSYYLITIILLILNVNFIYIILFFFGIQYIIDFIFSIKYYFKIRKEKIINEKTQVKEGFKFSVIQSIQTISQQIDKILIPIFLTLVDLAIYGMSMIIPNTMNSINKKLSYNLLFKKVHKLDFNKFKKTIKKYLSKILIFYIIYSIVVYLLTIIFFRYILEIENLDKVLTYTIFFIILSMITLITGFLKKYLEANSKTNEYLKIEIKSNLIFVFFLIVLIPHIKIIGILISKIIFEVIKLRLFYSINFNR